MLFKTHNPDVLECIANLSNDEVFTPPEIANLMLDSVAKAWELDHDGENIWENPEVKFLDPCAKSGVFLREITQRLSDGLASKIPNLQDRVNHILTEQVFGLAITELTALMTRRSVYCSKSANGIHSICDQFDNEEGHVWFDRTEHTWIGGRNKVVLDPVTGEDKVSRVKRRCEFCGANEDDHNRGPNFETHAYAFIHTDDVNNLITRSYGTSMQFDVVIGNPPYQLKDGGAGKSAKPLYHHFVRSAKDLNPRYISLVIPSRWMAGGKGLDDFRREMLSDDRIRHLVDYIDSDEAFPGVDIAGGVSYFLWNRDNRGTCTLETHILSLIHI